MSEENKMLDDASVLDADYDDEEGAWSLTDDLQVISSSADTAEELTESVMETSAETEETEVSEILSEEELFSRNTAILEGLLFVTGDEGLSVEQAMTALDTDEEYTKRLFDSLQKYYLDDSRGIEIAQYGGIYRFLSKGAVHPYAKKLFQLGGESKLSNAAMETLAIIAYKQPVTRVEIEEIRGVGADVMLRKLEARGLIRETGRSDAPGRPILYSVTDEFMNVFQLLSLDELPELPDFGGDEERSGDLFE